MNIVAGTVVLASASALLAADSAATVVADDPQSVYRAYTAALDAGRIDDALNLVVADAQRVALLTARPAAAAAESNYKAAIDKAFPGLQKDVAYGVATTRPEDAPNTPRVIITGDTATMTSRDVIDAVRFRRVDGRWKVDLNAMFAPQTADQIARFRGALVEVMNALTAEMQAGRFTKLGDVQAELATRIKMRLATPDLPATTRPAF